MPVDRVAPTRVANRDVLFVMATAHEYGPALQSRFVPLMCGVGPVEAGIATAAALTTLARDDALPDLVVSLGSAGSRCLEHAMVYQVASVRYRDMDASAFGIERGVVPFLDRPAVIELAHRIDGVPAATLSTGADAIAGDGYASLEAQMVDMETYAVLRACERFGVPMIGLRGISDGRAPVQGLHDWTALLPVIDARLAAAADSLAAQLRDSRIALPRR